VDPGGIWRQKEYFPSPGAFQIYANLWEGRNQVISIQLSIKGVDMDGPQTRWGWPKLSLSQGVAIWNAILSHICSMSPKLSLTLACLNSFPVLLTCVEITSLHFFIILSLKVCVPRPYGLFLPILIRIFWACESTGFSSTLWVFCIKCVGTRGVWFRAMLPSWWVLLVESHGAVQCIPLQSVFCQLAAGSQAKWESLGPLGEAPLLVWLPPLADQTQ
jgi:hypothetical protein